MTVGVVAPPLSDISTVITDLETWKKRHKPYERIVDLRLFRFGMVTIRRTKRVVLRRQAKLTGVPKRLFLSQQALVQLINMLGYKKDRYLRLSNKQRVYRLNYLIRHRKSRGKIRLRIINRNHVRALFSKRYRPFDDLKLLKIIRRRLGNVPVSWYCNNSIISHISLLLPRKILLKRGYFVQGGFHISNSEIGARSITIASHVYDLRSKNGFIGVEFSRIKHIGAEGKLRKAIRSAINAARVDAKDVIGELRAASGKVVTIPRNLLRKMVQARRLTVTQFGATLDVLHVSGLNPINLFKLSQALAQAVSNRRFRFDSVYKLRQAAVYVLSV